MKHWWIIEPAAKAIDVAACLPQDPHLAFASVLTGATGRSCNSDTAIADFVAHPSLVIGPQ